MVKTLRLDAFLTNLDGLLRPICEKLQMSPSRHDEVEERYKSVGRWLRECPRLSKYDLRIFPQGSYAIGTTLRPLTRCEFDLDFVLLLQKNWLLIEDAVELLDMLEERLLSNGKYEGMVERKNRCLRLKYANDFHMDILPAVPNTIGPPSCLLVPDEKARDWKHSNPEGFRDWFKNCSTERFDSRKQDPLPDYQTLEQKSTLQCAVQLIKRWRDIYYNNRLNVAPVGSIGSVMLL
jgi:Second Messenger Oligonucleotide or Dinucleotide Synthetase domain